MWLLSYTRQGLGAKAQVWGTVFARGIVFLIFYWPANAATCAVIGNKQNYEN